MASLFDVFGRLLLDDSTFQTDAVKAGEKAGDAVGASAQKRMGPSLKAAFAGAIVGGVTLLGAAVAKGFVELDNAVAKFTSDTGASADEAEFARKAINRMSADNLQPIAEIGDTLSAVVQKLHLTGVAAENEADSMLKFAHVAGVTGPDAVDLLRRVTDAYGKSEAAIPGIMDLVVAAHQKYGVAIADDLSVLALMAPTLKVFGASLEDGQALLNLFAERGVSATVAQRALNTAIQKVPPGTTFDDIVKHLGSIQDDGQRAAESIKIFGARAGAALASAIRPGMTSLSDFKLTTDQVTGATEKANAALENTWSARIRLAINGISASLRDAGLNLADVFGALQVAGAFGLAGFLKVVLTKVVGGMKAAGVAGGQALIDAAATATGAAGTIIGNTIAQPIIDALDPDKNSLLGRLSRGAAAKLALVYGAAFATAARIGTALANVITALPGMGILRSAILASALQLGTLEGTAMGTAAGLAFGAGIVLAVAYAASQVKPVLDELGKRIHDTIFPSGGPFDDVRRALANAPWPFGPVGAPDWAQLAGATQTGAAAVGAATGKGLRDGFDATNTYPSGTVLGPLVTAIYGDTPDLQAAVSKVTVTINGISRTFTHLPPVVRKSMGDIATAIMNGRQAIVSAMQSVISGTYDPLITSIQLASVEAELGSKDLRDKLNSQNPQIRRDAQLRYYQLEQEAANYKAQLSQWGSDTARLTKLKGEAISSELVNGLHSSDSAQKAFSQQAAANIAHDIVALMGKTHNYGFRTGNSYVDGLIAGLIGGLADVRHAFAPYVTLLQAFSPPGPESPLHNIDKWSYNTGAVVPEQMSRAIREGARSVWASLRGLAGGMPLGGLPTPTAVVHGSLTGAMSPTYSGISGGGITINGLNVDARGHENPAAVGQAVKQAVADVMAETLRGQSRRGLMKPVGG